MWQAPPKNGAAGKKKQRERARIPLHIRRVRAELKLVPAEGATAAPTVVPARVLMNDLSITGAGIFSAAPLVPGQMIELAFESQSSLVIRGRVIWCQEQQIDSHIVSQTPFCHRAGIQFRFESAEDEARLKKLYEEFAREILFGMTG